MQEVEQRHVPGQHAQMVCDHLEPQAGDGVAYGQLLDVVDEQAELETEAPPRHADLVPPDALVEVGDEVFGASLEDAAQLKAEQCLLQGGGGFVHLVGLRTPVFVAARDVVGEALEQVAA